MGNCLREGGGVLSGTDCSLCRIKNRLTIFAVPCAMIASCEYWDRSCGFKQFMMGWRRVLRVAYLANWIKINFAFRCRVVTLLRIVVI